MESKFWYVVATYLHLIGMAAYVGGAIVMEFVVGPAQKAIPPAQAQVMGEKTATRFLQIAWASLGLLLLSGILQILAAGNDPLLRGEGLLATSYGRTLLAMVVLWVVLVVNGAIITFVLRPRLTGKMGAQTGAAQVQVRQQEMLRAAERLQLVTRIDLGIALVLPLIGAGLLRGGIF